jgi:hypothetical protein
VIVRKAKPRRRSIAGSILFGALFVGCSSTASPTPRLTSSAALQSPSGLPGASASFPPDWAQEICVGYLTIVVPIDLNDTADTTERTSAALDALLRTPNWPPGDPIRHALLQWTNKVRNALAQFEAGDQTGAMLAIEAALADARTAGALLDRLRDETGLGIPC